MSAEVLRRAAALMRERAEAATPGPWVPDGYGAGWQVNGAGTVLADRHLLCNDAEHIASWHPAVALAVADWLDEEAGTNFDPPELIHASPALAVARAYLGEDQ